MTLPENSLQGRPTADHPTPPTRVDRSGRTGIVPRSLLLTASLLAGSLAAAGVNAETPPTGSPTITSASVPSSAATDGSTSNPAATPSTIAPTIPPSAGAPAAITGAPASSTTTSPSPATSGSAPLDPESDRRLRGLSAELRCLVCQNQTLADSNAELAVDLRRQVEAMIARGDSDAQIKTYLVDRYGDFVLYRPPVQGNTALLWFGPFALLAIGAIVWVLIQRRSRRSQPIGAPSADAEQRARNLLDD